jgi:predicted Zn-dependent peptidase
MSQHTLPPRHARSLHRNLPRGRAKLVAFEVAVDLAGRTAELSLPRGVSHLRDHLTRAADALAASSRVTRLSSRSEDDSGSRLIRGEKQAA